MKKNLISKITNFINNKQIKLYSNPQGELFINDKKYHINSIKTWVWSNDLFNILKIEKSTELYTTMVKYCVESKLIVDTEQKKLDDLRLKEEAKKAEKQAREEEREAKEAAKQAEKQAREEAKEVKEALFVRFVSNFNYVEYIEQNYDLNYITNQLNEFNKHNNIKLNYSRALVSKINRTAKAHRQILLEQKRAAEIEELEKIGYELTENGKINDMIPANYEKAFDQLFIYRENADAPENSSKVCIYYDEWKDNVYQYRTDGSHRFDVVDDKLMRTIVRNYLPIKNAYVVNDMWFKWFKENRPDNALLRELDSYIWDGVDRLGINETDAETNDNDNIILKVLGVEQTNLNKKMITYSLLHAARQLLWPTRFNFQHVPSLLGDTNCGKTKTVSDLFKFDSGIYHCDTLKLDDSNAEKGAKLASCWAVVWNENEGVNQSTNEQFKNFIDLLNGQFAYQKKYEQQLTEYTSHNIAFITYNPGQKPFLSDYSVEYGKRYWILECKMTESLFKEKYLNTINENHHQIWAQIFNWVTADCNENTLLELNDSEIEELKVIQSRYKGIGYEDLIEGLAYWLNEKTYMVSKVLDAEQLKDFGQNHLEKISVRAFNDMCKTKLKWDSRHAAVFKRNKDKILSALKWECNETTIKINGTTCRGYERIKNEDD